MMEIDDEDIWRSIAIGGSMDYSAWPSLLPRLIARIEKIAHEAFSIPNLPPPPPPPQPLPAVTTVPSSITRAPDSELSEHFLAPLPSSPTEPQTASSSPDTNKENNPVPPPPPPHTTLAPVTSDPLPPGTLPPQLAHMLSEITSYLTSTFPRYPPHTIQRIAELIVTPKQHYRSLVTYLHAFDRVVRVTSGLNVYPLPSIHAEIPGSLANGILETAPRPSPWASPGSDEALGGALLTPIPWLQHNHPSVTGSPRQSVQPQQTQPTASTPEAPTELAGEVRTESTETIDGPNGVGSIETVSVSVNGIPSMGARGVGVTQGELLRQEQRAGVVPVSQLVPSHHVHPGSNASAAAQQQQIQARIHHQRALAQSQIQARAPSSAESPDPSSSAPHAVSAPSSVTLEEEGADAVTDNAPLGVAPVHSNPTEDEEKPHARGPEEIGTDDVGPQSVTTSTLPISTTTGGMMQGIDIQAAVGRKPLGISISKAQGAGRDDDDKMDVEDDGREEWALTPKRDAEDWALTPKRDAEDQLEGSAGKKLRESPGPAAGEVVDAEAESAVDSKPTNADPEAKDSDQGDAMDKD